jgi:hypothetical protein
VADAPRAISTASERVQQPFAAQDASSDPPRFKASAAPVVIGLDRDDNCNQLEVLELDLSRNRTPDGPPGDGYSIYGVRTDIECETGSCDARAGQLCSSEAPGWGAVPDRKGKPIDHCVAYPLVTRVVRLIGYNFWDPCSATLAVRQLEGGPSHHLELLSRVGVAGEPIYPDDVACRASPDGVHLQTVVDAGTAMATFEVAGLPRDHFYTLQLFNRNGTMRTRHDVNDLGNLSSKSSQEARTLHVCWNCDPSEPGTNCPPDCEGPDDTNCAAARCLHAIEQTRENDGCDDPILGTCNPPEGRLDGRCTSGLWSAPPRPLSDPSCAHEPEEPARCAETPVWFGSEPDPTRGLPIVFVTASE